MICFVTISLFSLLPNQEAAVASREGGANLSPDFSSLFWVLHRTQRAAGKVPPAVPPASPDGSAIACILSSRVGARVHPVQPGCSINSPPVI